MNCSPYRQMYLSVFQWWLCALLEIVLMMKALFDYPPLHNKTFIPTIDKFNQCAFGSSSYLQTHFFFHSQVFLAKLQQYQLDCLLHYQQMFWFLKGKTKHIAYLMSQCLFILTWQLQNSWTLQNRSLEFLVISCITILTK